LLVLKGRLLRSARIIPLAPFGGIFLKLPPCFYEHSRCCALWSDWYLHFFQTYLAFQMGFSAVVPRTGLIRIVVRYFDSIAFTHGLFPITGLRFRCIVVTDYRFRTIQRWLISFIPRLLSAAIIKSA
jgi:hypothetical protein